MSDGERRRWHLTWKWKSGSSLSHNFDLDNWMKRCWYRIVLLFPEFNWRIGGKVRFLKWVFFSLVLRSGCFYFKFSILLFCYMFTVCSNFFMRSTHFIYLLCLSPFFLVYLHQSRCNMVELDFNELFQYRTLPYFSTFLFRFDITNLIELFLHQWTWTSGWRVR